jgi:hypothetical protein
MAVAFPAGIGMATGDRRGLELRHQAGRQSPASVFRLRHYCRRHYCDALAYRALGALFEQQARDGKVKSTRKRVSIKGVILSVLCGLLMGSFFPPLTMGRASDLGGTAGDVGMAYAIGVVFALGFCFQRRSSIYFS